MWKANLQQLKEELDHENRLLQFALTWLISETEFANINLTKKSTSVKLSNNLNIINEKSNEQGDGFAIVKRPAKVNFSRPTTALKKPAPVDEENANIDPSLQLNANIQLKNSNKKMIFDLDDMESLDEETEGEDWNL
jgi:hypothetical protein